MKLRNDLPVPTNTYLLLLMEESRDRKVITEELAQALYTIAYRVIYKPMYSHFMYRDDMLSDAVEHLCKSWHKFNPQKSDNPFAYFVTIIYARMSQINYREKSEQQIKEDYEWRPIEN